MLLRALLLLVLVAGASIWLTLYFGQEVLLALGLILLQLQIIGKKIVSIELPAILVWLKTQAAVFFRVELLKKWVMTTALPLLVGNALLRRIERFVGQYREAVAVQYEAIIGWYGKLAWYEKTVAALILIFATLGLSVASLGLWLILFSVKLPIWLLAAVTSLGRMIWVSAQKMAFRAVAFLQLGWLWRIVRRRLPQEYLDRKRRFDFRVARMVVRKRRMTVRQLAQQKDSLGMRLALIRGYFQQPRPEPPDRLRPRPGEDGAG